MSEMTLKHPLVRPRFLKWSVVVFVLLIPFVVHAVWDYVTVRRLHTVISRIKERGEPLIRQQLDRSHGTMMGEAGSARSLLFVRCGRIAVAAEQHRRERGAAPARIDDLVPPYLDAAPVDPYSGEALRFLSDNDKYLVYSVGTNQRDDGGRFTGREMFARDSWEALTAAEDIGIRIQYRK
jgi:hypothetical protein